VRFGFIPRRLSAFFFARRQVKLRYNVGMRRWLSIATFSLILLALPMWAQRRGGGGGAHGASGGSFGGHSFAGASSARPSSTRQSFAGPSSGSFHSGNVGRSSGIRLQIGNPYYRHRTVYGSRYGARFYYPYGAYYPYYGWYTDPLYYQNDDQTADAYAGTDYQGPYRDDGLQRDVQSLNGKIDRLQADVEARNRPKTEQEPATALVFRDQHVEEVRNYAIAGGTLWVLNDTAAKKIPLAQLDLPATVKMNDERGVDFQVPR
jgi:hypothetical protein